MKTLIVLQDVKTREYYCRYRLDNGFSANIEDALEFADEEEALDEMQQDYLEDCFTSRFIEVKKYYRLNTNNQHG